MNVIYFQPPGIKKDFCVAGIILESDPQYILFLNEPCKILISDVKIIDSKKVILEKGMYKLKK